MPTPSEKTVAAVLCGVGFAVTHIPTAEPLKRADLRAEKANEGHVIEVKTKDDDPVAIERHRKTLVTEGEAMRSTPMGRTNTMSGVFREAADQLRATPCQPSDFKLIWFMAIGRDQDVQVQQFQDTLYGTVPIIVPTALAPGAPPPQGSQAQYKPTLIPCYFYGFNEFFAASDIDGAVVGMDAGYRLCVNSHGHRAAEFRRTKLHELFACHKHHRAVVDPTVSEANGEAFIADCDIDRRNETQVLQYVRQKYGLDRHAIPFHGTTHIAEAIVLPPCSMKP